MTTTQIPFKVHRTKASLVDDTDWVGTKTAPTGGDVLTLPSQSSSFRDRSFVFEFYLEYVDGAGAQVAGRGTFNATVVVTGKRDADASDTVYDGTPRACVGSRSVEVEGLLPDDRVTVRIDSIAGPPVGATGCKIYYRLTRARS